MTMTSAEIRQSFLDYFEENRHTVVASSSLVLGDDPTLLFVNAGMVQFKDAFLGLEKRAYNRATTSQKCMRVAGKHNDLENVGPSPRHHTFFEMLGNFSLGDYFKKEAIRFGYDCLTKVYNVDPNRLYYTVHTSDDEAFELWTKGMGIDPERVYRMGDETNFWQMADVGPCGPTSEIHYDWGPEACNCGDPDCTVLMDNGCDRWLEIWNLVFMQFNQAADGSRTPLPKPGVDTGMGLERIVSVVQNQRVNYDTDLFSPIVARTQALLGHTAQQVTDNYVAYRVIADHGRAITFMIGDGVMPGNEGRASVLRLILRRAARYGRMIGFDGPFLAKIAETVIAEMGGHYIELPARRQFILNVITQEEERFLRTFNHGLELLADLSEKLKADNKTEIPGHEVFKLYATYGFPVDLTRLIADEEYGFTIDEKGYQQAFEQHTQLSGGQLGEIAIDLLQVYADLLDALKQAGKLPATGVTHDPYSQARLTSPVLAILRDGSPVETASEGETVELVLAQTPFYLESGGQMSDTGRICAANFTLDVAEVTKPVSGLIVHQGVVKQGSIQRGDEVEAQLDEGRRADIQRNHTATHLLHRELRRTLGDHVAQAGSLVAPDRLRFDFSHPEAVSSEAMSQIEQAVNAAILADYAVSDAQQSYADLKQDIAAGTIMALFGEKYGDVVRVVSIGEAADTKGVYSKELCGGTHVQTTGQIGLMHITSEGSAAAGVRRIEAVTGRAAQQLAQTQLHTLGQTASSLGVQPEQVYDRTQALLGQIQAHERAIKALQRKLAWAEFEQMVGLTQEISGIQYVALEVSAPDVAMLREMSDWFRDKLDSGVVVLATVLNDKPMLIVSVTKDLTKQGLHAGNLIKQLVKVIGGGGGGKPTMAQAGGKDASKIGEALNMVEGLIQDAVG